MGDELASFGFSRPVSVGDCSGDQPIAGSSLDIRGGTGEKGHFYFAGQGTFLFSVDM